MSAALPPWRRLSPDAPAARVAAIGALVALVVGAAALILGPAWSRLEAATARAERLDIRAAALTAAADARRAEAAGPPTDAAALAAAERWLAHHAPLRDSEAAMLDLLSSLRLIAEAAGVELASAAPLGRGATGRGGRLFEAADMAGLTAAAAEARIIADHAGLARFLGALEAATPMLRAAAIDIAARSTGPAAETRRLTARIVVGALSRSEEP